MGDAAGRYRTKDQAGDFSACDVKFAVNVGIKFSTPEVRVREGVLVGEESWYGTFTS